MLPFLLILLFTSTFQQLQFCQPNTVYNQGTLQYQCCLIGTQWIPQVIGCVGWDGQPVREGAYCLHNTREFGFNYTCEKINNVLTYHPIACVYNNSQHAFNSTVTIGQFQFICTQNSDLSVSYIPQACVINNQIIPAGQFQSVCSTNVCTTYQCTANGNHIEYFPLSCTWGDQNVPVGGNCTWNQQRCTCSITGPHCVSFDNRL